MDAESPTLAIDDSIAQLERAQHLLDSGQAQEARRIILDVLADAQAAGSLQFQARSLAQLGHCDRVMSRLRRAHESSQHAAILFRSLGDAGGEAVAQSTISMVCAGLGRNEDALEAGLLAVRLSECVRDSTRRAIAHNVLGVAFLWSGRSTEAAHEFNTAIALAKSPDSTLSPILPLVNMAYAEAFRLQSERFYAGALPDARRLVDYVDRAEAELQRLHRPAPQFGLLATLKALVPLGRALALAWTNQPVPAPFLAEANERIGRFPHLTWLHAMRAWVRCETCWTRGELDEAVRLAREMISIAAHVEHEQLACMGHVLVAQLCELRGRAGEALAELRTLRRRERRIHSESIANRQRAVDGILWARDSALRIDSLCQRNDHLERLSHEDDLTGLANRRFAEHRLAAILQGRDTDGWPLSVAFIDVDDFKRVNDGHSHRTGDAVLRAIAGILLSLTRERDVVVRLGGDEFLIVFPRTDEAAAVRICERIRQGIAGHAWDALAPGLDISLSVGVVQAREDDSITTLLARGDVRMYDDKRSRPC